MAWEVTLAAVVAVAGVIGLLLWVDHRVALEPAAAVTFSALVAVTVAASAVALRVTALRFPLGAAVGALVALAAWVVVVTLVTHPSARPNERHPPP